MYELLGVVVCATWGRPFIYCSSLGSLSLPAKVNRFYTSTARRNLRASLPIILLYVTTSPSHSPRNLRSSFARFLLHVFLPASEGHPFINRTRLSLPPGNIRMTLWGLRVKLQGVEIYVHSSNSISEHLKDVLSYISNKWSFSSRNLVTFSSISTP